MGPVSDQQGDKYQDDKNFETGVYLRRRDGDSWELCTFEEEKLVGFKAAIFDEESGRVTSDLRENRQEIGFACDVQDSQGENYQRVYHERGWAVREDVEDFSLVNALSRTAQNERSSPSMVISREKNISNHRACQAFENLKKIPAGHVRAILVTGLPNEGATSSSAHGSGSLSPYDSLADLMGRQGYILAAWAGERSTIVNRDEKPELFDKVAAAVIGEDFNDIHSWIVREKEGDETYEIPEVDICFSSSTPGTEPFPVPSNELEDSVVKELLPRKNHVLAVLGWMSGEHRELGGRVSDAISQAFDAKERVRSDSEKWSREGGSDSAGRSEWLGSPASEEHDAAASEHGGSSPVPRSESRYSEEHDAAAGERENAPTPPLQRAFWQTTPHRESRPRANQEILKRAMQPTESSKAKEKASIPYTPRGGKSRSD